MKKIIYKYLLFTTVCLLCAFHAAAYDVKIVFTDGTDKTFPSAELAYISVEKGGTYQLKVSSGVTTTTYDISQIREVQILPSTSTERALRTIWAAKHNLENTPSMWAAYLFYSNSMMCNLWQVHDGKITATRMNEDGTQLTATAPYTFSALYSYLGYSGGPALLTISDENSFFSNNMGLRDAIAVIVNNYDKMVLTYPNMTPLRDYVLLRRIADGYTAQSYQEQMDMVTKEFSAKNYRILVEGDTLLSTYDADRHRMTCTIPDHSGSSRQEAFYVYYMPDGMYFTGIYADSSDTLKYKGHSITGFEYRRGAMSYDAFNDDAVKLECIVPTLVDILETNYWFFNELEDLGPVVGPMVKQMADSIYNDTSTKEEECLWLRLGKEFFSTGAPAKGIYFCYNSGGYVCQAQFTYESAGDNAITLTAWEPSRYPRNQSWDYYKKFGLDKCADALLATYEIEFPTINDMHNPENIVLRDRNNPDNVLRLHSTGKSYPLRTEDMYSKIKS